MAFLEVKNIKKNFGNLQVLKGIDFTLEKGQVLAIIGSSGSGKTTLLRCLNFLESMDEGEIYVGDFLLHSVTAQTKNDENALRLKRLHFGLVFQNFNLFPQYNVLQNLMIAPKLLYKSLASAEIKKRKREWFVAKLQRKKELVESAEKAINQTKKQLAEQLAGVEENAKFLLNRVGLSDKIRAYPCELSGGQSQRVAIARALALRPDILCFDEPTSALDPELTGEVLKVIKGLKDSDRTMIVVTHEMDFAYHVADKIIFMADGVIEESGTPDEIFNHTQRDKTKAFLAKSESRID